MIGQTTNVLEPKTQTAIPTRPPVPPFTHETAIQKVRLAEDDWKEFWQRRDAP